MTTRLGYGLIAILALAAATPAEAQPENPDLAACYQEANQVAIGRCIARRRAEADDDLNAVYNDLMTRLTGPQQRQLRDAERAWIRFRDANCAWHRAMFGGGSGGGIGELECLYTTTRARADELSQW